MKMVDEADRKSHPDAQEETTAAPLLLGQDHGHVQEIGAVTSDQDVLAPDPEADLRRENTRREDTEIVSSTNPFFNFIKVDEHDSAPELFVSSSFSSMFFCTSSSAFLLDLVSIFILFEPLSELQVDLFHFFNLLSATEYTCEQDLFKDLIKITGT